MIIDWLDYYSQAIKEGGKPDRVIERIRGVLQDCSDKETEKNVIERLQFCVQYGKEGGEHDGQRTNTHDDYTPT